MVIGFLLKVTYFMLPAYFANMAPVFVGKIKFLDKPIDFGKKIGKEKVLGSHKTWRGLIFGTLAGILVAYIQFLLMRFDFFRDISILNYTNWLWIGFLLGFGALFGDLVKSFFKRREKIEPGKPFIPWDQVDYSLGALLFISLFYYPGWKITITAIVLGFIFHIAVNHLGYYSSLREVKW